MKRLLAPRAQITDFGRSAAALAASRGHIAVEMRGGSVGGDVGLDDRRYGRRRRNL